MNKVYDFNWIVQEVDNSIIIMLYKDNKLVGGYQARYILAGNMYNLHVKFANVDDLDSFLNYAVIRFCDVRDSYNVIDIPISMLKKLYDGSNKLGIDFDRKRMELSELDSFAILNKKRIKEDYLVEAVSYNELSDELNKIIDIASKYRDMGMQERFDALASINLANYHVERDSKTH